MTDRKSRRGYSCGERQVDGSSCVRDFCPLFVAHGRNCHPVACRNVEVGSFESLACSFSPPSHRPLRQSYSLCLQGSDCGCVDLSTGSSVPIILPVKRINIYICPTASANRCCCSPHTNNPQPSLFCNGASAIPGGNDWRRVELCRVFRSLTRV